MVESFSNRRKNNELRRKNNELRSAIERLQNDRRSLASLHGIYGRMLDEVTLLTHSPKGLIIEIITLPGGAEEIQVVVMCNTELGSTAGPSMPLKLSNFDLFKLPFINAAPQIYQVDQLAKVDFDPLGWHKTKPKQFMMIPLVDRDKVFSILCIADSEIAYKPELAKYLWPLLTTCICIRRAISAHVRTASIIPLNKKNPDSEFIEQKLTKMEKVSFEGIIEINQNHKITRFNPAAERIFDIGATDAIGLEITVFLPESFPNEHRIHTFSTAKSLQVNTHRRRFMARNKDDKIIPVDIAVVSHAVNDQTYFTLLIHDNSELQAIRHEQEEQTQRFKVVSDLAPVGILQTTSQWECVYVNDRWCDICKMTQAETKGMGWINAIHNEDVRDTLSEMRKAMEMEQELNYECRFQTPVGDIVWIELHARPLFTPDGHVDGFLATLSDKSYRRIMEQKLRNMAELDPLTGLTNRALFQDRLQHALQGLDRRRHALVLLSLDLDGFKNINDTFGHNAGDNLLKEVAKRVASCVRNEDTVARVGGDEFTILMEDVKLAHVASDVANKILLKLAASFSIEQQEVFITTSIGIAITTRERPADSQTLLKQADIALYRAKSEGKNNFQYYSSEMEQETKDRLYLGNSLHRALNRGEFEIFYQLQAALASHSIVGSEALLRWRHSDRGLLSSAEFIPLLEETGLISPVSRWLIKQACHDHQGWIEKGLISQDSHISVNLAPRQLREPSIIADFEKTLSDTGLSGANLVVEITESALLEESKTTTEILSQLKQIGIKIALDDFGTGYSSLTYLKRFPIDYLKIDQTFIRDILKNTNDKAITEAIIKLAESMELTVIAEGVESLEILALLEELGCPCYQGYLLNKPCDSKDTQTLLESLNKDPIILPFTQLQPQSNR